MIPIEVKLFGLGILLLLALVSDIMTFKIKNIIVFPFMIIGPAANLIMNGIDGLLFSVIGLLVPMLLLFILFALKMLGAGDIKLFGAIGAIMGVNFVLYAIACSFLAGGLIALLILLVRKNGRKRLTYFIGYLKSCILTFSLLPYTDFLDKNDGARFRFSYAVMCGTIIGLLSEFNLS